jgi:hypothetical protein
MIVTTYRSSAVRRLLAPVAAGALAICLGTAAIAQSQPVQLGVAPATDPQPQAPQPQGPPPAAEPQRPVSAPGLFAAIGKFVDESIATVSSGIGSIGGPAGDAVMGAAGAAKDAAAIVIPSTAIVSGRAHCPRAANGGPDCQMAAEFLCRKKGYTTGSSLRVQAEQKCPVWGWIAGDKPVGKCTTETYLTSASCR